MESEAASNGPVIPGKMAAKAAIFWQCQELCANMFLQTLLNKVNQPKRHRPTAPPSAYGKTLPPQRASVMSSTRRTETPARYISMSASSTLLFFRMFVSQLHSNRVCKLCLLFPYSNLRNLFFLLFVLKNVLFHCENFLYTDVVNLFGHVTCSRLAVSCYILLWFLSL